MHMAPGLTLMDGELNQVRHHAVLAHGLAVQAIRAHAVADVRVRVRGEPRGAGADDRLPEHVRAAEAATRELNAPFLTVMLEARYTDAYLAEAGGGRARFTDDELATISRRLDSWRINPSRPSIYVEPEDGPSSFGEDPMGVSHPTMHSSAARSGGDVLGATPRPFALWSRLIFIH